MPFGAFTSSCDVNGLSMVKIKTHALLSDLYVQPFSHPLHVTQWVTPRVFFGIPVNILVLCFIRLAFYIAIAYNIALQATSLFWAQLETEANSIVTTKLLPLYIHLYFASNISPDVTIRWLSTSSEVHKYILITNRYHNYERLKNGSSK